MGFDGARLSCLLACAFLRAIWAYECVECKPQPHVVHSHTGLASLQRLAKAVRADVGPEHWCCNGPSSLCCRILGKGSWWGCQNHRVSAPVPLSLLRFKGRPFVPLLCFIDPLLLFALASCVMFIRALSALDTSAHVSSSLLQFMVSGSSGMLAHVLLVVANG